MSARKPTWQSDDGRISGSGPIPPKSERIRKGIETELLRIEVAVERIQIMREELRQCTTQSS